MTEQPTVGPHIAHISQAYDNICRVCRSEGTSEKPLYHPCVCTGSIKYIHQECLVQWLKYSKKEYCELCNHPFSFAPVSTIITLIAVCLIRYLALADIKVNENNESKVWIRSNSYTIENIESDRAWVNMYSADMPKRLPFSYLMMGLVRSVTVAVKFWLHYTLVALAWLIFVPLTAYIALHCIHLLGVPTTFVWALSYIQSDILLDSFAGCFVVVCTLTTFVSIIWLRDQILMDGGPAWLNPLPNDNEPQVRAHLRNRARRRVRGLNNQPEEVNRVVVPIAEPGEDAPLQAPPAAPVADPPLVAVAPEHPIAGIPEEPANVEEDLQANNNNNEDAADHWNLLDFDRAEEMSWERLLGLDGSLLFLEHVFWIVSMNISFILIFAFTPYHIGLFTLYILNVSEKLSTIKFHSFLTSLFGYFVIALILVSLLTLFSITNKSKIKRLVGICYMIVKVSLLIIVEIGLFPLICGWWLDICSLSMFSDSFKDRLKNFDSSPVAFVFIRWLIGMIYVFYFASFILLLREVIRPGVLFFIRNINDPDFNPIQEMIHIPIYLHVRRFLASILVFGSIVVLMLYLPIKSVKTMFPTFLPYNVKVSKNSPNSETPVHELSLELLLLQVILPALLEQGYARAWLKNLVMVWCLAISWLLGIRSYLLGDQDREEAQAAGDGDGIHPVPVDPVDLGMNPAPVEPLDPSRNPAAVPAIHAPLLNLDLAGAKEIPPIISAVAHSSSSSSHISAASSTSSASSSSSWVGLMDSAPASDDGNSNPNAHLSTSQSLPSGRSSTPTLALSADPSSIPGLPPAPGLSPPADPPADPPAELPIQRYPAGSPLNNLPEDMQLRVEIIREAARIRIVQLNARDAIQAALGDVHRNMLIRDSPLVFQSYARPSWFISRIILLCVLICITLFISSTASLVLPVYVGRRIMAIWNGNSRIHELYTCACGLYTLWAVLRVCTVVHKWVPLGWPLLVDRIRLYGTIALKTLLVALFIMGLIPLLLGLLLDFSLLSPIRVPMDENPIYKPWQIWAFGVLHMKLLCVCITLSQSLYYRQLEQGFLRMDLKYIFYELCFPVLRTLTYAITIPYVLAHSIIPMCGFSEDSVFFCQRYIYPFFLAIFGVVICCIFQAKQFRNLYEHIKNDRYLVGKQLVNYNKTAKIKVQ